MTRRSQLFVGLIVAVPVVAGTIAALLPIVASFAMMMAATTATGLLLLRTGTSWRGTRVRSVLQASRRAAGGATYAASRILAGPSGPGTLVYEAGVLFVRPHLAAPAPPVPTSAPTAIRLDPLALARLSYYGGVLFMGVQVFRPLLGFTISDVLFVLATVGALFATASGAARTSARLPAFMFLGASVFSVGALISTAVAPNPLDSLDHLAKFLFVIAWFWAGSVLLRTPRHISVAVGLWVATIAMNGVAATAQLMLGDIIPGGHVAWGRMTGMTDHFNDLGGAVGIVLAPALALTILGWSRLGVRMVFVAGVALMLAGLFLSGSVGGMLAGLVSVIVWIACSPFRLRRRTVLLAAGGVISVLSIMAVLTAAGAETPLARLDQAAGAGGTFAIRVETYEDALWNIRLDPMVGTGLDQGPTRNGHVVHSFLLGSWFQVGALGAIGLTLILGAIAVLAVRVVRDARTREERVLALALFGAFFGFLTLGLAQPLLLQRYAWIPTALLMALHEQQAAAATVEADSWRSASPRPDSAVGAAV